MPTLQKEHLANVYPSYVHPPADRADPILQLLDHSRRCWRGNPEPGLHAADLTFAAARRGAETRLPATRRGDTEDVTTIAMAGQLLLVVTRTV